MADGMTSAEASNVLEAVRVLEELERSGDISPRQQQALDTYRAKRPAAEQEQIKTAATYRGLQSGVAMNFDDEIRGAAEAVKEFMRSGDTKSASAAYRRYRDLIRQKNEAAQMLAPEEYASGQFAGMGAGMVMPSVSTARLMQGMGALPRVLTGMGAGATAAALPQIGEAEGGPLDRLSQVSPATAATGAAIGALAPAAGALGGATTRAIQDVRRLGRTLPEYSGAASRRVASSLGRAERSGEDIEAYLASLGPEGMVADIPGAPLSRAQGLAVIGGEGADVMARALRERAAGAGQRIEQDVSTYMAQPGAAFAARAEQARRKASEFGPLYDAAKDYPDPINIDALRSGIALAARDQSSAVRSALSRVLSDLGQDGPVSALRLHNARAALSDAKEQAFREGAGEKGRILKNVLDDMDRRLDKIPGYATARGGWADASALERAIADGRSVFTGGPLSTLSPADLRVKLSGMTDPQREAFKKGAREYLEALMGTSRNDAAAAWGAFDKEFNAEKLRLILGADDANAIMQRLQAEKTFSRTRSKVLEGSETQARKEAADALSAARVPESSGRQSIPGRVTEAVSVPINRLIDEILYGRSASKLNRSLGELLSMQGQQRDVAVERLLRAARDMQDTTRAQQIVEALFTAGALTSVPLVTE